MFTVTYLKIFFKINIINFKLTLNVGCVLVFLIALIICANTSLALAACSQDQIDINSATSEELQNITGIGPTYAERIIQNRSFENLDELTEVKGIGEITLSNIKDENLACVDEKNGQEDEEEESEDENADEDEDEKPQQEEPINQPQPHRKINFAPKAEAGENIVTNVGSLIYFDASQSSDPDGDDLTYFWNLGNGDTKEGEKFNYVYSYPGKYVASLEAGDGQFSSRDSILITILPGGLVLSEACPNPEGKDKEAEWIEIENTSDQILEISGWKIDDKKEGSKPFVFPDNTLILANSFLVFRREATGIALNNGEDKVRLLYPSGEVADELVYESSEEGHSIARKNDQFFWTGFPTPSINNIIYLTENNLEKLKKETVPEEVQATSSKKTSLSSNPKKALLTTSQEENLKNSKNIFEAKKPTLEDLDSLSLINEVLAKENIQASLGKLTDAQKPILKEKLKKEQPYFISKIIKKPEFTLFITLLTSGLIFGVWINLLIKKH